MKWKKRLTSVLASSLLLTAMPAEVFAYDVPDTVRVGLESVCKNVSSATIGVWELSVGTEENGRFTEGGILTSNGVFTAKPAATEYLAVDEKMDFEDAMDLTANLLKKGYDAYAAYLKKADWTVYVKDTAAAEIERIADADTKRVTQFEGFIITGGETPIIVPETAVLMGGNVGDTFKLNGYPYRGMLTFSVSGSTMTAVNVIDLEEYLYGVVPSEMPQSYEKEALQAQAVAARTYAMTKLGAHTGSGYQLCDGTNCQVYKGYSNEAASTTAAVEATAGEILCYNGSPIEAVFSASTGGYTENSENVWSAAVPYLRAVPEIAEYGDNTWTRTLTLDELTELLNTKGAGIGEAKDILITKLSTGGRVQELQIVGTKGTKTLNKETIRTYFSAACGSLPSKMFTINGKGGEIGQYGTVQTTVTTVTTSGNGFGLLAAAANQGIIAKTEGALSYLNGKNLSVDVDVKETTADSTAAGDYEIYNVNISTVQNGKFVFEGVGNGHGVGLSQKGAQAMAQLGYDYEDILYHYYTGVTIED